MAACPGEHLREAVERWLHSALLTEVINAGVEKEQLQIRAAVDAAVKTITHSWT